MDNKKTVFVVIYECVNNRIVFVYDTPDNAKSMYDTFVCEIPDDHELVRNSSVRDYAETGDCLKKEYSAYREGYYSDEHYNVSLIPTEVISNQ